MRDDVLSARDITPLPRSFYERDAVTVARELLGALLVRVDRRSVLAGRIVEAEAYRQDDPASHSFRGQTPRTEVMFGPPGFAYVYLIYGVHECFNAVCEPEGAGAAVLVRAIEPVAGESVMAANRLGTTEPTQRQRLNLTSGPGKLTQALGISRREYNGVDLCSALSSSPGLLVGTAVDEWRVPDEDVREGSRVGITRAVDHPWRFWVSGNPWVSG